MAKKPSHNILKAEVWLHRKKPMAIHIFKYVGGKESMSISVLDKEGVKVFKELLLLKRRSEWKRSRKNV